MRIVVIVSILAAAGAAFAIARSERTPESEPAPIEAPLLAVADVAAGDMLNLRAAPDARAGQTGALAPDATGIAVTAMATDTVDWVKVEAANDPGGQSGWAHARYLAYDVDGRRIPVRLRCFGTEPFWSVELGYGRADANLAYADEKRTLALGAPVPARARPNLWLVPGTGADATFFALIEKRTCSDGMSDSVYSYAAALRIGGALLDGCCR